MAKASTPKQPVAKQLAVAQPKQPTLEEMMREHLKQHNPANTTESEPGAVVSLDVNPFQAAKALERYGPWGVVVLLTIIMFLLYRSMDKRLDKMAAVFSRSNKQFITLIEKITKAGSVKKDKE